MTDRYFKNPYADYQAKEPSKINKEYLKALIKEYLGDILENIQENDRGDLYVGNAGIAYMILKLHQCNENILTTSEISWEIFNNLRVNAKKYAERKRDKSTAFLCGSAGIHIISAAVLSFMNENHAELQIDLQILQRQLKEVCTNDTIPDEILVGKAGFLSGIYWLNHQITPKPFSTEDILQVCHRITETGREYSKRHRSLFPLMYDYHESEYLGAAHGISGILLMLLQSPWFEKNSANEFSNISKAQFDEIKATIDGLLDLQDSEGNFPTKLRNSDKKLVHWCHGASGIIYLAAKSFLVYGDEKYLKMCEKCADLVWHKGLLRKGPGLCHGIAGNGYVHLLLFRLTQNPKYLYRATKFAEFLKADEFCEQARTPDRPFSL